MTSFPFGRAMASLAWMAAGALILLGPAIWNGYPLFFFDSFQYVLLPFGAELPVYRTAAYGLFAGIGRLADSLWAIVAVQAALMAIALWVIARALSKGDRLATYLLLIGAAVLGGLPWYSSQIMADGFAGFTILGTGALMLHGHDLDRRDRITLALLLCLATVLHSSHIGLTAGLLGLGGAATVARRYWPDIPRLSLALPAGALLCAIALSMLANWAASGRIFLFQPAKVQTLALYVENGLARRYLDAVCPLRDPAPYRLCAHRKTLPPTANEFLWGHSPFRALGGFAGMETEAAAIVSGATRMFPGELARQTLWFTGRQFVMTRLGDGLVPMQFLMRAPIAAHYPAERTDFERARQQQGTLNFAATAPFEMPLYLAALAFLGFLAIRSWRQDRKAALLCGFILAGLLGNAFICGALSNPNHRYQGRLVWLPLAGVAAICRLRQHRTTAKPIPGPSDLEPITASAA